VAFAGKSNVGKSSLINAIMNRKSYARTSQSPGKTQTINYYNINDEFYLVDLPGYGYAKAGKELVAGWGKLIEDYLYQSKVLKSVFLLIDIRHEPSENDRLMYDWVRSRGYEPVIIATKADKIKRSQLAKQTALIRKTLGMPEEALLFPFSALSKQGRDEVVEYIELLINE
jgi:GTP-binding protein